VKRKVYCKACGIPIIWKQTKKGRWCPYNSNGKPHFGLCKHEVKKLEKNIEMDQEYRAIIG